MIRYACLFFFVHEFKVIKYYLGSVLILSLLPFSITVAVKKEGWGGGGSRTLSFTCSGPNDFPTLAPSGKTLKITVGEGLPKDSRTFYRYTLCVRLYRDWN